MQSPRSDESDRDEVFNSDVSDASDLGSEYDTINNAYIQSPSMEDYTRNSTEYGAKEFEIDSTFDVGPVVVRRGRQNTASDPFSLNIDSHYGYKEHKKRPSSVPYMFRGGSHEFHLDSSILDMDGQLESSYVPVTVPDYYNSQETLTFLWPLNWNLPTNYPDDIERWCSNSEERDACNVCFVLWLKTTWNKNLCKNSFNMVHQDIFCQKSCCLCWSVIWGENESVMGSCRNLFLLCFIQAVFIVDIDCIPAWNESVAGFMAVRKKNTIFGRFLVPWSEVNYWPLKAFQIERLECWGKIMHGPVLQLSAWYSDYTVIGHTQMKTATCNNLPDKTVVVLLMCTRQNHNRARFWPICRGPSILLLSPIRSSQNRCRLAIPLQISTSFVRSEIVSARMHVLACTKSRKCDPSLGELYWCIQSSGTNTFLLLQQWSHSSCHKKTTENPDFQKLIHSCCPVHLRLLTMTRWAERAGKMWRQVHLHLGLGDRISRREALRGYSGQRWLLLITAHHCFCQTRLSVKLHADFFPFELH